MRKWLTAIAHGRAVTLAEQQTIEQYLAAQWNVI